MSQYGNNEQWLNLIDSQVPDILNLIVGAWATMPAIAPDALEDPISEELCRRLMRARDRLDMPFIILTQVVELENDAEQDQGRIDIVFFPLVPREFIYFALECKRINVLSKKGRIRSYFAEYVKFGMLRFVRGKYSSRVKNGGMLAFVLDGNASSAVTGVENNFASYQHQLCMSCSEFRKSPHFPDEDHIRETIHNRDAPSPAISLHHFFMACSNN